MPKIRPSMHCSTEANDISARYAYSSLVGWAIKPILTSRQATLQDHHNTIFASVVNAWDMQIKTQSGKLALHKLAKHHWRADCE